MVKDVNQEVEVMDESEYLVAFQIITAAGTAKGYAMEAIEKAREYKFNEAEELIEKAREQFNTSHEIQTNLLTLEAQGKRNSVNIIMVHAQDHLTMANMAAENACEFLNLYKLVYELKNK